MKPLATIIAVLALLAGCNSAPSSLNMLSPYGTNRVPAPSTGSYSRPDTYYQPGGRSNSTGGAVGSGISRSTLENESGGTRDKVRFSGGLTKNPMAANRSDTSASTSAADLSAGDSGVRFASATQPVSSEAPIRIVDSQSTATDLKVRLKGMPVNDVTQPPETAEEPAAFVPEESVRDLSEFPRPPASANPPAVPLRTINSPAARESPQATEARSSDNADEPLRWGTRSNTATTERFAKR
jgi:hypothetical protein